MNFNYIILYTTEENNVYIILLFSYKFLASLSGIEIVSGSYVGNLGDYKFWSTSFLLSRTKTNLW